jgi:predicted acylesterase/phospholipase RssA
MAIPGVFTPVNYEDWLLVVVGALNSIPDNVVKQMGTDVVIAVDGGADVEVDPNRRAGQDSLLTLLGRTIDAMMTAGVRVGMKDAELVVDPDLRASTRCRGGAAATWPTGGCRARARAAQAIRAAHPPHQPGTEQHRLQPLRREPRRARSTCRTWWPTAVA